MRYNFNGVFLLIALFISLCMCVRAGVQLSTSIIIRLATKYFASRRSFSNASQSPFRNRKKPSSNVRSPPSMTMIANT